MKIINKHIDDIKIGDTVLCKGGKVRTVGSESIKIGGFIGTRLFGDPYKLRIEPVKVVIFK